MKKSNFILPFMAAGLILLIAFAITACDGSEPDYYDPYTISFNSMGAATTPPAQSLYKIEKVTEPTGLKNSVLELEGWYKEITFVTKWNFASDTISENMTLYARWILKDGEKFKEDLDQYFDDKKNDENSIQKPLRLPIAANLGMMLVNNSVLENIFDVIAENEKFIILDLSLSTVTAGIFDLNVNYGAEHVGKANIVELVLPEKADTLYGRMGLIENGDEFFSVLENIRGIGIIDISATLFDLDSINSLRSEDDYIVDDKLKKVDFPKVKKINSNAFTWCTALEEVNFPELIIIEELVFNYCTSLEKVDFPKVEYIGKGAFASCEALEEANFPLVTYIDDNAFEGCIALETVNIPRAVIIGDFAFAGCEALEEANFPLVTEIGDEAFAGCEMLEKTSFPRAVTIGESAFEGCAALETAVFPRVASIGEKAFFDCDSLKVITFGAEPPELPVSGEVFCGETPDEFTIKRPAASTAKYDTWLETNSDNFNDSEKINFSNP